MLRVEFGGADELPRHRRRRLQRQEDGGLPRVVGEAHARVGGPVRVGAGVDEPRIEQVDGDAGLRDFGGQGLADPVERRLRGPVGAPAGASEVGGAGGHVHHDAAALFDHQRHDRLADEEGRGAVDVHDPPPLVDLVVEDGDVARLGVGVQAIAAGVVDQDVDAAERLDGLRRHAGDLRGVG